MEATSISFFVSRLLSWRAVVDIVLLAAVLFFLYRTLVRLGTWKIGAGVLVAILLYLVAALLDLKGIEWIFGNVSHVAVIALIVIFQPELRKLFERAVSMRRAEKSGIFGEPARTIEEAAARLAQQKRGAIIVFPGREPVREWFSGGEKLDAQPSASLLLSIFDPHSPGHDGALIVENGRFSRYGVRLPVSDTAKLPQEYGTRHHAAMGLAEKTDALVIVVSEERGAVSVFHKGSYDLGCSLDSISQRIHAHWKDTASYPIEWPLGKGKRGVSWQMAASFAVALLFWSTLVISQAEILEKVISVPVEYTASPQDLVMVGDKQREVRLHLTGAKSDLDSIAPAQLAVKIDLAKAVPGEQTFIITDENIRLPRGIGLVDVDPDKLTITLAEIVEEQLPIEPQLVGKLPEGLTITGLSLNPASVKALLPAAGDKPEKPGLTTTPIYLESLTDTTRLFCKIIAPPSVQPTDRRWPDVEVTIEVERVQRK